ncbi:MAG: hypothetical protein JWN07_777 [Hyphomicrobiales bacterium]|nr:hypothetical protein [Hyphomicrobiales bacterium]
MNVQSILAPAIVQAFLTLTLLFVMGYWRFRAFKAGEVNVVDRAASKIGWPRYAAQAERSFLNQFETPLLFFAVIAFIAITRTWDALFVTLAWIWVITRIAHAFVHCTSNRLSLRFPTFVAGVVVLLIMWVLFAVKMMA